eukprot:TRINITY_DN5420_c0_g2_i1.p1 TRINITY_DN5420_c0_g2~~TRINITY_DN5420_c0_g2_i1.p1  ORF type:complete len:1097 (-),score=420.63 TRINITY_DN5420_c0_g2_i1:391-3681(-)
MSKEPARKAQVVGSYSLGAVLGKGGFGTVYAALDTENGDFVAVKQINLGKIPKDQLNGIMTEIDLLKNLHHPNIVKYVKYMKTKESLYIVLEFVENGSLASIVKKYGVFPESLVAVYIAQVLVGLLYLHEQGVVHRDIKGANILTTKEGVIKLADFGVATKFEDEGASAVVGTPYWMAPEIIELNGATTKADIWSVGCTVIELLTGQPPYYDLGPMPALFRIVQDDCPPLPEGISPALKDWLSLCFQKDPMLRVSANKLLKHRWIQNAKKKQAIPQTIGMTAEDAVTAHNEAIKEKQKNMNMATKVSSTTMGHISPRKNPSSPAPPTIVPEDDEEDWGDIDFNPDKLKLPKKTVPPSPTLNATHTNGTAAPLATSSSSSSTASSSKQNPPTSRPTLTLAQRKIEEEPGEDDWDADFDGDAPVAPKKGPLLKLPPVSKPQEPSAPTTGLALKKLVIEDDGDDWDLDDKPAAPKKAEDKLTTPAAAGPVSLAKYTEEDGEDDWLDTASPSSGGGQRGKLDLADKFKTMTKGDSGTGSANLIMMRDDEADDDDPFGEAFEDESEDEVDLDTTLAKDNFAKMSETVIKLLGRLQPDEPEDTIRTTCDELIQIFKDFHDQKSHLIRHHGVIPIMDMLEVSNATVVHSILKVVNQIISNNMEIQENLCLVGGIPAIMKFSGRDYAPAIRLETASFIEKMCSTSTLTLQMFIACRGLPVLVDFLQTPYNQSKSLVWMAIDAISSVFELQSPTPKNDFCRLFAKAGLLRVLASVLTAVVADPEASRQVSKIATLFLVFSAADSVVRKAMAQNDVATIIFSALHSDALVPENLVKILKSIKQLSMDLNTLSSLQHAGAIPILVPFLADTQGPHVTDIHNQVLNTMYNLCRIDPERQALAAAAGIIPHLQRFITSNSPLKQFALPIICDLAHVKRAREELWKHRGVDFYLDLLRERYWQVNALDSLSVWLLDETSRVEALLSRPANTMKLAQAFSSAESAWFENFLIPFLRIVTVSPEVNVALGTSPSFVPKLVERLTHATATPQVRINLLKILTALYEGHPNPKRMIAEQHLYPVVRRLAEEDRTVLVLKMASDLLVAFNANDVV